MKPAIVALFLLCASALATANDDQDAYCRYVTEQAAAERDLLRAPSVTAGFTQPNSGLPMQAVWGLSTSVANNRRAALTFEVARQNCQLYRATTEAQMHVQYALPAIEVDALRHRLELIQQAADQLEHLVAGDQKLVEAQNMTLPAVYPLESALMRLNSSRAATAVQVASAYVPPLSATPIRELIASKLERDRQSQKATARLDRQSDWDVALSIGVHDQIRPWSPENSGGYGEVTLSYNLADRTIGRHLDRATDAYAHWKENQEGDVAREAEMLRKQIADAIQSEEKQLALLQEEDKSLAQELERIAGNDSAAALAFRNQLTADQLALRVDLGDIVYRLDRLRAFLHDNF